MRGLGTEPRTRMYLGIGRELFVLAKDPSPEALSKAMVRGSDRSRHQPVQPGNPRGEGILGYDR